MSWTLGGVDIGIPKTFNTDLIEKSAEIETILGKTTKDVFNQKRQYVIELDYLTASEANAIVALWESGDTKQLVVSETYLNINTTVLIDIRREEYQKGPWNWIKLTLTLKEEQ